MAVLHVLRIFMLFLFLLLETIPPPENRPPRHHPAAIASTIVHSAFFRNHPSTGVQAAEANHPAAMASTLAHSADVTGVTDNRPMRTNAISPSSACAFISASVTGR